MAEGDIKSVRTIGEHMSEIEATHKVPQLGHVEALEDLTLIGGTVSVHSEGSMLIGLAHVLLGEGDTSTDGHLSTDNTVSTEERFCEDMHRAAFTVRHSVLASCEPKEGEQSLNTLQ